MPRWGGNSLLTAQKRVVQRKMGHSRSPTSGSRLKSSSDRRRDNIARLFFGYVCMPIDFALLPLRSKGTDGPGSTDPEPDADIVHKSPHLSRKQRHYNVFTCRKSRLSQDGACVHTCSIRLSASLTVGLSPESPLTSSGCERTHVY